jgi:hypothetical protein
MFCVDAGVLTVHSDRTTPVMVWPFCVAIGTETIVISPVGGATRSACQPAQTSVRPRFSRNPSPCGLAVRVVLLWPGSWERYGLKPWI